MPYIQQKDRRFWDRMVDAFLEAIIPPGSLCPSKSGLTYALSRIVWALFNRFPTHNVASDLCAVLMDVRDEFKRRKLAPLEDCKIVDNGDLPEGPQPVAALGPEAVNIQQVPKSSPVFTTATEPDAKTKVIKLSDLNNLLSKGFTMGEAIKAVPGEYISHTDPLYNEKCAEAAQKSLQSNQPKPFGPAPLGGAPKPKVELSIIDPDAEKNAETALLRAHKALAIAMQAKAEPEIMRRLHDNVLVRTAEYLKVLGVKS